MYCLHVGVEKGREASSDCVSGSNKLSTRGFDALAGQPAKVIVDVRKLTKAGVEKSFKRGLSCCLNHLSFGCTGAGCGATGAGPRDRKVEGGTELFP